MKKVVIGSISKGAGKTSVIVGLSKALDKSIGYMKPFGDRLLYRKKRLWDYDSALVSNIFDLDERPEDMSIGFEHAKLRYMYDEAGIKKKLGEVVAHNGKEKDVLFVEGPKNLSFGISTNLDVLSVAKNVEGKLVLVVSGNEDSIVDHSIFIKNCVDYAGVDLAGIIVNKVHDVEDFKNTYQSYITDMGINVLGVVPYEEELDRFTVSYLADILFTKVIAGEAGLNKTINRVFVGAMSASSVMKEPYFVKEENKLVITAGDRSDMIVAALETNSSAIILTNNILPPPNIISKASELNIPLLLVSSDTFKVAKQIDDMEPLLTKEAGTKIDLLASLIKKNVNLDSF